MLDPTLINMYCTYNFLILCLCIGKHWGTIIKYCSWKSVSNPRFFKTILESTEEYYSSIFFSYVTLRPKQKQSGPGGLKTNILFDRLSFFVLF